MEIVRVALANHNNNKINIHTYDYNQDSMTK